MEDRLSDRLRKARPARSTSKLKVVPPLDRSPIELEGEVAVESSSEPEAIERLLPHGYLAEFGGNSCFVVDTVHSRDHLHGGIRLDGLSDSIESLAGLFRSQRNSRQPAAKDLLFLDTETTGFLGAGTIAFMVGVGFYENDSFVVRQYFLRDHGDEVAMLPLLLELLEGRQGLVTFNGRSFDLPMIESRLVINRMFNEADQLGEVAHFDMLPAARRLWKRRLGSCSLGALEGKLLSISRKEEDVPGREIPDIYLRYLRSGDGREISRVFYHNYVDILSLVALTTVAANTQAQPSNDLDPVDSYSLGRWQSDLGRAEDAEDSYLSALKGDLPLELYRDALYRIAAIYKREDRRFQAVEAWMKLAATSLGDTRAHVELAMHFEWKEKQLYKALKWTQEAQRLASVDEVAPWRAEQRRSDLAWREQRLLRKIARDSGEDSATNDS